MSALLREARANNGIPNEGDYTRSNMVGYSYSITTGTSADSFNPDGQCQRAPMWSRSCTGLTTK